MRLLSLKVKNIKTYVDETIRFSDGINCILGLNGGGKSTIIESIGYALFGYCKGKNAQMVRHGEKQGSIELEFIANDGLRYRIEKVIRAKGGGKSSMYDENMMIFDKEEDISACVKRVLHIQTSQRLEKIYEDVIAVPQGKYVSVFLNKPADRKKEIDKLLGLDQYREIWLKLRDVKNYIETSEKTPLLNDSARLSGASEGFEGNLNNRKKLSENISKNEQKLAEINTKFSEVKSSYIKYQKFVENASKIAKNIDEINNKINAKNELKNNEKNLLISSKKSLEIVQKNTPFFNKFNDNEKAIKMLSEKQKEFANISKQSMSLEKEIATFSESIRLLSSTVENEEIECKELEEQIKKRELILSAEYKEYLALKEDYNDKISNLENKERSCEKEQKDLAEEEIYLNRFYSSIPSNYTDLSELDMLQKQSEELDKQKKAIEDAKYQLNNISKELIALETELSHKEELLSLSKDGLCPIFNCKCVSKDKDISCEINDQIKDIKSKIETVKENYSKYEIIASEEQDNYASIFNLQAQIKDYNNVSSSLLKLKKSIGEYYDISDDYDVKAFLDEKIEKLKIKKEELDSFSESIKKEKAKYVSISNDILSKGLMCESEKKWIDDAKNTLKKKNDALSKKRDELSKTTEKNNSSQKLLDSLQDSLIEYDKINNQIEELRNENNDLASAKEEYLSNINNANKVNEISSNISKYDDEIKGLEKELDDLKLELDTVSKDLNSETIENLEKEKEELGNKSTEIKTIISKQKEELDELNKIIFKQQDMLKQKEQIDKQIDKCNNKG